MQLSFKVVLKGLISLGILAVLAANLQMETLLKAAHSVSPMMLLVAVLAYLFGQALSAVRWRVLAGSMGISGCLSSFYRYYLIGMFLNLFLPTAIGGDVGRAALVAREQQGATWLHAMLSVVAERACGLVAQLGYIVAGLLLIQTLGQESSTLRTLVYGATVMAIGLTFGFRWLHTRPWGEAIIQRILFKHSDTASNPAQAWPHWSALVMAVGLSLVLHTVCIGIQWVLLQTLNVSLPFLLVAAVYGLAGLSAMIPVSLNGIGLREGTLTLLLVTWGHVPRETATLFSLVWLAVLLLATLPGAWLALRDPLWRNPPAPDMAT
jgi:uncharacterized membrane protein YbhN (UPF0104 family)